MIKNNKKRIWLIGLAAILFFSVFYSISQAESIEDISSSEDDEEAQKQLEELQEKADKYREKIEGLQKEQESLNGQISIMNVSIDKVETEIEIGKKKIEDFNGQINRKQTEIRDKEETISFQKKILGDLLKNFYNYQQQNILAELVSNEQFEPFLSEKDRLAQTGGKMREVLTSVRDLKKKLEDDKVELENDKNKLAEEQLQLGEKNAYLAKTKNQKTVLLGQAQGEENKYQKLLDSIENEIYELESDKVANYANLPSAKKNYFKDPVESSVITQDYGCLHDYFARRSYPSCDNGAGGFHNGMDFGKDSGSKIFSVRKGKVIASGNSGNYAYGQWLAVDHGDGLVTLYGHLSEKYVGKGDKVDEGEKIGKMGSTGYSTGTHLHFTVFDADSFEIAQSKIVSGLYIPTGASVDPERYL